MESRSLNAVDPAELVRELVELAGRSPRPLILALGAGWVHTASLELPSMTRKELSQVLARRAAKLAGLVLNDVQFGARLQNGVVQLDQEGKESRYLLAAGSRARLEPLRRELLLRGRRVIAVLPARLARLSFACARLAAQPEFCRQRSAIVVDVEARAVVTSLLSGNLLLSQSVLDGDLDSVPTLPLAMLQELKNLDAFHRKVRRGVGVSCVFVLGLGQERAQLLGTAARASLSGVQFVFEPGEQDEPMLDASRNVSMQAAAHDGPFSLDLRAPIPLGKRDRGVLVAASTLAVLGLAGIVGKGYADRTYEAQDQRVRAEHLGVDRRTLAERELRADATLKELDHQLGRLTAVASTGFEPGETLARIGTCLPVDVLPWSISIQSGEFEDEWSISGRVSADPLRAFRSLEQLRTSMEALAQISSVSVDPQSVLGLGDEGTAAAMDFDLRATLRRGQP